MRENDAGADREIDGSINAGLFKLGMRRLAASVCLITAGKSEEERVGLTATAVCSVSADPPTVLCCVNRSSASYGTILKTGAFAVNVLTLADQGLADRFSSGIPAKEKFTGGSWIQGLSPTLETAFVSFDCRIDSHVEIGTHGILFGRVERLSLLTDGGQSLLYAHGRYGSFAIPKAT
ncbi:flavin reductase family protein [Burkholderia anthina]|uniref:Flavin reductase family protein n=1 Tax=Burkholderia anthina TaxID=179879 RepID=A0ABS2B5A6_9BURK|nr:flavin reductase family protein [Burkholderia anthina]MBM2767546.1 flavin reductase family protein [Burkholderia anthina]